MEHEPIVAELQNAWLEGYRQVAPVSKADEAMLPVFVMLRRMLLTAWIASHSDTETARRLGTEYTEGTVAMGERFLRDLAEANLPRHLPALGSSVVAPLVQKAMSGPPRASSICQE